jgi:protein transport protein SEC23
MQFKTIFRYKNTMKMRVTTVCRQFTDDIQALAAGFDQEAATVALARYAVYKAVVEEQPKVSNYLDKTLLRFTSHFANYTRDDVHSFSLPAQMKSFPQFMYHLRRCQFISTFGTSPDEVLD